MRYIFLKYTLLFLLTVSTFLTFGQNKMQSPYEVLSSFKEKTDANDYDGAAVIFPKEAEDPKQLAIHLKQILDGKGLKLQMSEVPRSANYKDSTTQENIYVLFPKVLPEVFLVENNRTKEWRFSVETVQEIPKLHKKVYPFGTDVLVNLIPVSDNYEVLGLKSWQYLGILILLVFAFVFYLVTTWVFKTAFKQIIKTRFQDILSNPEAILGISKLLSLIFIFWVLIRLFPILQFDVNVSAVIITGIQIMRTVFFTLLALRLVDLGLYYSSQLTKFTKNTLDDQVLPLLQKGLNIIITIFGVITVLKLLNVNVTALIAGISIGGLALALAAQDTVKNLIGSVMIFIDKPFQIGDFIIVAGAQGSVEEVGFRSTRIRTTTNSVTSIPNGILAGLMIDNLGMRIYRRFKTDLTIAYHTTPEQIEKFVEGIRTLILAHPKTRKQAYEVYFHNISPSSLDIMLSVYFEVSSSPEELKAKQELLLQVLQLAKKLDIDFAFTATSAYVDKGK
jgi:MscS family membrane protein